MNPTYVDIDNARDENYRKKLKIIQDLGINPFSKENISDPRFEAKQIIYETEHWFVFQNQSPYPGTKQHFVIVSQKFHIHFEELSIAEMIDYFAIAQKICDEYDIPGGGLIMRFGETKKSGATVVHLHAQIIEPETGKVVASWFGSER